MSDDLLHLIPLGGVGAIGMNAMLIGWGDDYVLLDCGVMFPDAGMVGVDLILPSLKAIGVYRDRIRGIVLTHGHEDHIGALPHVLKMVDVPVYGTRFTLGLVREKLLEHEMVRSAVLHTIRPGAKVEVGPFGFEFVRVTHSIPDCVSLAIQTPIGRVVFTGDFKIDDEPIDGQQFDRAGFKRLGDEGVLLLMSDSTNAEIPGRPQTELSVGKALEEIILTSQQRILVALFSSNLYRVRLIVDAALKAGRKVALLGRSLHRYVEVGTSTGAMPFDKSVFIDAEHVDRYAPGEVLVILTGSQGEKRAALVRAAQADHPFFEIKPDDLVIMSSRQIPGNEKPIARMFNELSRRGADILHARKARVHASGHAYQEDLREVLQLVRPRYFMPVHGEHTFLVAHAKIAKEVGVDKTIVIENGVEIGVRPGFFGSVGKVETDPWYVDGPVIGDYESLNLHDRKKIGWNGVVGVRVVLRRKAKVGTSARRTGLSVEVDVQSRGLYTASGELLSGVQTFLVEELQRLPASSAIGEVREQTEALVRRYFKHAIEKRPSVMAFVDEVA